LNKLHFIHDDIFNMSYFLESFVPNVIIFPGARPAHLTYYRRHPKTALTSTSIKRHLCSSIDTPTYSSRVRSVVTIYYIRIIQRLKNDIFNRSDRSKDGQLFLVFTRDVESPKQSYQHLPTWLIYYCVHPRNCDRSLADKHHL
jgi:hypothetical protein